MATRLQDLPLAERLKLVEDLWDSIAADEKQLPLTAEQRRLLDDRLDQYELDRESGESAEAIVERIRRSL